MQGLAWDAYIMYDFPQRVARNVPLSRIGCEQQERGTSANRRYNRQYAKNGKAATETALLGVMG
jgi:hypothetical protein